MRAIATLHREELARDLFGFADKGEGQSGRVRLYDAFLRSTPATAPALPYWVSQSSTVIRHGIAIDPITGTVAEHKLFRHEYVPADSEFDFELEADELSESDLALLLGLLAHWNGETTAAIGKGKTRGQGRLQWEFERLEVLNQERYLEWLSADKPVQDYFSPIDLPEPGVIGNTGLWTFHFRLIPTSPLLVNEPGYVHKKNKHDEHLPDLEYNRLPDGRPIVPAASLRGLLRGRARRIAATIAVSLGAAPQKAGQTAESIVNELFGSTEQRSPIVIDDAVATGPGEAHHQYFNAIDRFTGGVATNKLYSARAVICNGLEGAIHFELDRLNRLLLGEWWRGLLLLVLRDALEGDLAIGWGKARGYGAFQISATVEGRKIESWAQLLGWLEDSGRKCDAQQWIDSLHDKIEEIAGKVSVREERHA
ncbi:MAG: RAMP superfamily CRISPR-associated protein [Gammaproteobacteria bacterium]